MFTFKSGKYQGKTVAEVFAVDRNYLEWMVEWPDLDGGFREFLRTEIARNIQQLRLSEYESYSEKDRHPVEEELLAIRKPETESQEKFFKALVMHKLHYSTFDEKRAWRQFVKLSPRRQAYYANFTVETFNKSRRKNDSLTRLAEKD